MVYAFIQDVPIGEDLYRRSSIELGPEPMAGTWLICVSVPGGNLRYIDVWESEEAAAGPSTSGSTRPWTRRSAGTDRVLSPPSSASTCCTPAGR